MSKTKVKRIKSLMDLTEEHRSAVIGAGKNLGCEHLMEDYRPRGKRGPVELKVGDRVEGTLNGETGVLEKIVDGDEGEVAWDCPWMKIDRRTLLSDLRPDPYTGSPHAIAHRLWEGMAQELGEDETEKYIIAEINAAIRRRD